MQGNLVQLDACPDDSVWGLNRNNEVFILDGDEFKKVDVTQMQHISCGPRGVLAVTLDGKIAFREGVTALNKKGTKWTEQMESAGKDDTTLTG